LRLAPEIFFFEQLFASCGGEALALAVEVESMQNPGEIMRPLIKFDHRWQTGSPNNDDGRGVVQNQPFLG
jgi:hypothetical protein